MKKLNKLFGLMLIAGCSMSLASNVNAALNYTPCNADTLDHFKSCATDTNYHVIKISGSYELNTDITVNGKRIVVDAGKKFTIGAGASLTLTGFIPNEAEDNAASGSKAKEILANIWIPSNGELDVKGNLTVTGAAGNGMAIGIDGDNSGGSKLTVDGNVVVTGYEQGIRISDLTVNPNGVVETSNNNGNGINAGTITMDSGIITSHDNKNGITAPTYNLKNGSSITAYNNEHNGVTITSTSDVEDSDILSYDNHTNPVLDATLGVGTDLYVSSTVTAKGETTINAGTSRGSGSIAAQSGSTDNVEVTLSGTVTVSGVKKGIIWSTNTYGFDQVDIYSIDDDASIILPELKNAGSAKVVNHTDKDVKVYTADSKDPITVVKNSQKDVTVVEITAKVDGKVSEGKVILFKGQTLVSLSDEGKAKLDEMLAKEGQHINNYVVSAGQALTSTYPFNADTQLTATYYIILKFGDVEIYANPDTKLSDLGEKDKATLEKIKNATGRKFMYFAVDGKAISETDTVFSKDTEFLVLYEGDAAPVVPDVEPEPGEPSKPDDGTDPADPERDPSAGEKDPSEELPNNQPTGDNVMGSVAMGIAGLVGIVGSALVFDKKTNYNN